MWQCRARGRPPRSGTAPERSIPLDGVAPGRGVAQKIRVPTPGVLGVGGARGRERAGPTRSHPEPGRDPAQRRRVLWGRPHGRRGRRGHPPPSDRRRPDGEDAMAPIAPSYSPRTRRGVEQRQLVGLITQSSGVRIPPPLPHANAGTARCRRCCFFQQITVFQWREQSGACFDFRRNHQLLPTRCRIRHRSRVSQALRRMRSARHVALRWLQCGVAPIQHSMVRSMWCSDDLFPLQVPFDT
jgi:hypothetical protein